MSVTNQRTTAHLQPLFFAAAVVSMANLGVAIVAAPLKAIELGAEPVHLGLMGGIGSGLYLLATVPCGSLADRYGAWRMAVWGALVMAAGLALLAAAPTVWWMMGFLWFNCIGQALFWPAVQGWVASLGQPGKLGKTMGSFNLSWSTGGALGALLAGPAYSLDQRLPFFGAVVLLIASGCLAYIQHLLVGQMRSQAASVENPDIVLPSALETRRAGLWLLFARLSNFAVWFVIVASFTLFPKYADNRGLTPFEVSLIIFGTRLGLWPGFLLLRNSAKWHFNAWFAQGALLVCALCTVLLWVFTKEFVSLWPIVVIMGVLGLVGSATYAESLLYGWLGSSGKSRSSGVHEMVLGSSSFFGPLISGAVAQVTNIPLMLLLSGIFPLLVLIWFNLPGPRALQRPDAAQGEAK